MKSDSDSDSEFVVAGKYLHAYEAHIAKGLLESEGIPAEVQDEGIIGVHWLLSNAVGGVKLWVRQADLSKALEVLSRGEPEDGVSDLTPEATEDEEACPRCGSKSVSFQKLSKRLGGFSLILGIPIPVRRNRYRCDACGYSWKRGTRDT
jgi:DNA-directed RNA polymerase subunit M/transcription elongation factor TFIIS